MNAMLQRLPLLQRYNSVHPRGSMSTSMLAVLPHRWLILLATMLAFLPVAIYLIIGMSPCSR